MKLFGKSSFYVNLIFMEKIMEKKIVNYLTLVALELQVHINSLKYCQIMQKINRLYYAIYTCCI